MRNPTATILLASALFVCCAFPRPALAADKASPEETVAKSLEAFAPAELRAPAEGRELDCQARWRIIVGGNGALEGNCQLLSRGPKTRLNMDFQNSAYPGENIVYSGEGQPIIGQVVPGRRSTLGDFIYSNPVLVRSGLFGGVLTSAWPLFNFDHSGAKLISRGQKKVDGEKLNEFEYQGPRQGDTKIFLYFDPETGRHVRSEYRALTPALHSGNINNPTGRDMTTIMEERFSEFRSVYGMTIPLVWTVRVSQEQGAIQQWQFTLIKQKLNVPDDAFAAK